jgi:hypothetical protein
MKMVVGKSEKALVLLPNHPFSSIHSGGITRVLSKHPTTRIAHFGTALVAAVLVLGRGDNPTAKPLKGADDDDDDSDDDLAAAVDAAL